MVSPYSEIYQQTYKYKVFTVKETGKCAKVQFGEHFAETPFVAI